MFDAQYVKRPGQDQSQAAPVQKTSETKRSTHTGDLTRLPHYSQAWGNLPPPWLRLPVQRKENTTGLPTTLKAGVENLSGLSMDDVQVHYNSSKPAEVQALAYTQGTEIHVGPGQEQHLSHEAWHVAQQKQGRVKPTIQVRGRAINDDQGLEKEADVMGTRGNAIQDRALQVAKPDHSIIEERNIIQGMFGVIQRTNGKKTKVRSIGEETGRQSAVKLREETVGNTTISIFLDAHQNKHQYKQIGQLDTYPGAKGEKFPENVDLAYHQNVTARIVLSWVQKNILQILNTKNEKGRFIPESKYELSKIIDFDVVAERSKNGITVTYHCNPNRDAHAKDFR